jgi:hypothetical protein
MGERGAEDGVVGLEQVAQLGDGGDDDLWAEDEGEEAFDDADGTLVETCAASAELIGPVTGVAHQ